MLGSPGGSPESLKLNCNRGKEIKISLATRDPERVYKEKIKNLSINKTK
jgi:hypothetical protein